MSITRRSFMRSAVAATAVVGPVILHAENKSGSKKPRVGTGAHTYECIHDWGMDSLPAGHGYGSASHGVAIDSEGLVYITHHGGPDSIFVFDPKGKFVRSFGEQHVVGEGQGKGHGIDFRTENGEEYLYLSPNESSLFFCKMNKKGEIVWSKDRATIEEESGLFEGKKMRFRPTNVSFRPDGGYYLGDGYGSHYIFEFDKDDEFVRAIGGPGTKDGQFKTPHGQWLDARDGTPKLVVCDRANKRLQWFDMAGKHLKTMDGFLFPADIDVQGDIMLVPDLHARVTLLDKENKVLTHLGDDEDWRKKVLGKGGMRGKRDQWKPGKFVHPHDACFDADGNIFVAEWAVTGRVSKLVKVG